VRKPHPSPPRVRVYVEPRMNERGIDKPEADEVFLVAMYELLRANGAFPGLDAASDPVSIFRRMKAQESPAFVRRATKEGVADVLEMTRDLDGEGLASVDRYLVKRGAPSLTAQRLLRSGGKA